MYHTLIPLQSNIDIYSTQTISVSTRIISYTKNSDKRPRFYNIISLVNNISSYPQKIPTSINIFPPLSTYILAIERMMKTVYL